MLPHRKHQSNINTAFMWYLWEMWECRIAVKAVKNTNVQLNHFRHQTVFNVPAQSQSNDSPIVE